MSNKKVFPLKDFINMNLEITKKSMDEELHGVQRSAPTDEEMEHYLFEWKYVHILVVNMPDGQRLFPDSVEFQVPASDGIGYECVVPDELQIVEEPIKEIFQSFEMFLLEYYGIEIKKH